MPSRLCRRVLLQSPIDDLPADAERRRNVSSPGRGIGAQQLPLFCPLSVSDIGETSDLAPACCALAVPAMVRSWLAQHSNAATADTWNIRFPGHWWYRSPIL